jgi:hypothetical protein
MIATIAYARTMYKGHKLNSEDYSQFTENEMTEDYGNSKLPGLLQGLQGDWTPLKKASDQWIAAMPKTS